MKEVVPAGYKSTQDGFDFANVANTMEIPVTKTWLMNGPIKPPDVTFNLVRSVNGTVVEPNPYRTHTLISGQTSFSFTGLPTHDNQDNPYTYEVEEVEIKGYDSKKGENNDFTNTSRVAALTIQKIVTGTSLTVGEFQFEIIFNDDPATLETFTLAHGQTKVYDELPYGMRYAVKEIQPEHHTIVYDGRETGTMQGEDITTVITNEYHGTGEFNVDIGLNPTKILTGRALADGEFGFELRMDGVVLQTVYNTLDGNIPFAPLAYTEADIDKSFTYTINEIIPAGADKEGGMTYDTMVLTFTVDVTDLGGGKLSAVLAAQPADTVFNNVYEADGTVDIETTVNPTKSLTGRALADGEFTFELRQGGTMLQRARNDAQGNVPFAPLVYTEADIGQTYAYTIVEIPGTEENMTYTDMALNFTVSVEDAGDGELNLTTVVPANVIFYNVYEAPDEPVPPVVPVPNFDLGVVTSNVADCLE